MEEQVHQPGLAAADAAPEVGAAHRRALARAPGEPRQQPCRARDVGRLQHLAPHAVELGDRRRLRRVVAEAALCQFPGIDRREAR
jgi:hypothetical protein